MYKEHQFPKLGILLRFLPFLFLNIFLFLNFYLLCALSTIFYLRLFLNECWRCWQRTDVQICVELFHFGLPYNFLKLPLSWHLTPFFLYCTHCWNGSDDDDYCYMVGRNEALYHIFCIILGWRFYCDKSSIGNSVVGSCTDVGPRILCFQQLLLRFLARSPVTEWCTS